MHVRRGLIFLFALSACDGRDGPAVGGVATGPIEEAFAARRSKVWVEGEGTVARLLRDDVDGDRHQRWILELESGHTLLFAHNVDVAPRVPLREGDTVRFRGRYEFNEKGGVIHWTHRDTEGGREGGWIEWEGRRYR